MNHEKLLFYTISLFLFWGFWSWFVFLNSLSVLWFSFVFLCTCFRFEMFISVLGFVFLFSGSVFLFWVCCTLFLHWRYFFVRVSALRSLFLFWDLCFCFLRYVVFFCFGFAVSFFSHWRHPKKRETVFALCFRLLFVASEAINYRARIGIHFYPWCTKNSTRKEIRSFHNTENSYCTTLKRIMRNITCNNIITWNFQGTVKPL